VRPGFAINVGAAGVGGVARPTTGGIGAQMRGAGQLRIQGNVAKTAGWLWRRAAVVQRAVKVIIGPLQRTVEIDNAIVQRTAICAAANAGGVGGQRTVVQRAAICAAAAAGRVVAAQRAVVQRAATRTAAAAG